MSIVMTSQVTLNACLFIIGLLGLSIAFDQLKNQSVKLIAYNQCIYDNQIEALK